MNASMTRGVSAALLAVALAACGGGADPDAGGSPTPTSGRPTSTGTMRIVEPQFGATVEGPDVTVRVEVEGATILERASRDLRPDTGHVHVILVDEAADDEETLTLLAGAEYTITGLEPGEYLIKVEFAAADHGSFEPPVIELVKVTVT